MESRLVVLDTVVTDRKGTIVTNLTRNDFRIYDNGVLQPVHDFDSPADRPTVPAAPHKDRNGHDDWGESPLTMLVVDEMDTPFEETAYARGRVERYLKAQPAEIAEPTILLWLDDSGLHPVTVFTRDRDLILAAVTKHPPSIPDKLTRGAAVEQISSAFAALQQAALFSRGAAGKKEIIWVGRSFPTIYPTHLSPSETVMLSDAVRSTIDLLLASRVSVYVIDPTANNAAVEVDGVTGETADTVNPQQAPQVPDLLSNGFDLNLFAVQTGGHYYKGRNDLDRQVGESIQRGAGYYTLTYVPSAQSVASDYHAIRVVMTNPNLIAQTKQGYYAKASSDIPLGKVATRQRDNNLRFDLYEAIVSGMQYSGIGASVQSCQRDKDMAQTTCIIHVDTGALTYVPQQAGDERADYIGILAALGAKGKILTYTMRQLALDVPASQVGEIHQGFTKVTLQTAIPSGTKIVRVVIRDASGRIGNADLDPTLIPAVTTSTPLPRLGAR